MSTAIPATAAGPKATSAPGFLGSTVGLKIVMASTGILLVGFVLAHLLGNLQVYLGADAMNAYGRFLHEVLHGGGLWVARVGLLAAVAGHVGSAIALAKTNADARPIGYRQVKAREATYASRTMRYSGFILFAFVCYHLAHFTTGQLHPDFQPGNVYRNFIIGFQSPMVSAFYIVSMVLLGLHLRHGV